MLRKMRVMIVACLGFVSVSACANSDGVQDKFYDAARKFNSSLRWGDFDRAAEYLPGSSVNAFLDQHEEHDEELIILEYNIKRMNLIKKKGIARARVEMSWHTDRDVVVRKTTVDETWQYYGGKWFLVDEHRISGDPVTIFSERETDEEHPYLPGLKEFRENRGIGLTGAEKRKFDSENEKNLDAQRKAEDEADMAGWDETTPEGKENKGKLPVSRQPASFSG